MALHISQYSSLVFGFGIGESYPCTGSADKQYALGTGPTTIGTTGTLDCVNGPAQSIVIGAAGITQNTYWGGTSNRFWQQVDWEALTDYNFGIYGNPTISVNGCYMDADCGGSSVVLNYLGIPRVSAVLQSSNLNSCVVRVTFAGQIKFSEDSTMNVYQDDGSGNWILLASMVCPANTQNTTFGYIPYADVTFTGADVGNSFHFKSEVIHNGGIVTNADCYITIGSTVEELPPIDSAENSFIQFGNGINDPSCGIVRNVCFPVIGMDDVQFQLVVDAAANGAYDNFPNNILGDGINSGTQLFLCICDDCSIPTAITQSATFDNSVALLNDWVRDGETWDFVNKLISWGDLENYLFTNYATNQCFRICLCKREPAVGQPGEWVDTVLGCMTDCFQLIDNYCYTTAITYYSNTNNYCFHYMAENPSYVNKIRLPMYLRSPQYPSTEKGYQKSNGDFVKLSERINEEWLLEVGWIPGTWHKALKIALSHDYISVDNSANSGLNEFVYCNQPYDILWEKRRWPYPLAKGATKLFKQINLCSVNSNC
jgi:hypothetical protein